MEAWKGGGVGMGGARSRDFAGTIEARAAFHLLVSERGDTSKVDWTQGKRQNKKDPLSRSRNLSGMCGLGRLGFSESSGEKGEV